MHCASLIFSAYARLALPHVEFSRVLSSVVPCLPYLVMVSVFWKYLCSLQIANNSKAKIGVVRSRAYCPCAARVARAMVLNATCLRRPYLGCAGLIRRGGHHEQCTFNYALCSVCWLLQAVAYTLYGWGKNEL